MLSRIVIYERNEPEYEDDKEIYKIQLFWAPCFTYSMCEMKRGFRHNRKGVLVRRTMELYVSKRRMYIYIGYLPPSVDEF